MIFRGITRVRDLWMMMNLKNVGGSSIRQRSLGRDGIIKIEPKLYLKLVDNVIITDRLKRYYALLQFQAYSLLAYNIGTQLMDGPK